MQDGIVMYTTSSITTALGFPKDMWSGRSFVDFVHERVSSNILSIYVVEFLPIILNRVGIYCEPVVDSL